MGSSSLGTQVTMAILLLCLLLFPEGSSQLSTPWSPVALDWEGQGGSHQFPVMST